MYQNNANVDVILGVTTRVGLLLQVRALVPRAVGYPRNPSRGLLVVIRLIAQNREPAVQLLNKKQPDHLVRESHRR